MIRLTLSAPTATLSIERADKRNAMTQVMWDALPRVLDQAAADPEIRVVLLQSATPGIFCAGADIAELLANKDDSAWRAANQRAINEAQHVLTQLPLPTLAFIDGDCIGGGTGLALACDLRIATARARFAITPAKLGLVYPLHDTKLLVDLVGPGQAKRLLFTGEIIDAQEALRIGLIEAIADAPDAWVNALCAASPSSIREIKHFTRRIANGQSDDDASTLAVFADAFTGADFLEGTTAFVEKRRPEFGT